ncbi:MAG: carbon-nitrogen hydrolase family protein [Planctomycetota bacterium]
MPGDPSKLRVALLTNVFFDERGEERLRQELARAREDEASLAVLPELPLNSWCPATRVSRSEDAEPPGGRRHLVQSRAASEARIGLIGGAIVLEPESWRRFNAALVFAADGKLVSSYRKLHLPDEEYYWEAHHFEPGDELPTRVDAFRMPIGIQICSDINRPTGAQYLAALGTEVIVVPRATPAETYERWRLVMRAVAASCAVYVVSVNRPGGESGAWIGGPSVAIDPRGEVLLETKDLFAVVTLDSAVVRAARTDYPGYLAHRSALYARAWQQAARSPSRQENP